jgi:anti-anti-sigma regulatory factor
MRSSGATQRRISAGGGLTVHAPKVLDESAARELAAGVVRSSSSEPIDRVIVDIGHARYVDAAAINVLEELGAQFETDAVLLYLRNPDASATCLLDMLGTSLNVMPASA